MLKKIFILSFGMLMSINVCAQSKKIGVELSEVRKQKNQIDLDIRSLFSNLGNASLIYKRAYQKGDLIDVNSIKLVRFLARFDTQITFTDDPSRMPNDSTNVAFFPSNYLNITAGIGLEKQFMNKNFVHYFGVDGLFNFYKNNDDYNNGGFAGIINNATRTTDRLVSAYRVGLNPFFGIKYYFTKRISLGIETGFSVHYFNQKTTEVRFEQEIIDQQLVEKFIEDAPVKSHGIQTRFNNLRFLTVGYTF